MDGEIIGVTRNLSDIATGDLIGSINRNHSMGEGLQRTRLKLAFETGLQLRELKNRTAHGAWENRVNSDLVFGPRQAARYMQFVRAVESNPSFTTDLLGVTNSLDKAVLLLTTGTEKEPEEAPDPMVVFFALLPDNPADVNVWASCNPEDVDVQEDFYDSVVKVRKGVKEHAHLINEIRAVFWRTHHLFETNGKNWDFLFDSIRDFEYTPEMRRQMIALVDDLETQFDERSWDRGEMLRLEPAEIADRLAGAA